MKISSKTITWGFIIAGLMNMSVLVHSRFFTNATIPKHDLVVMSNFGLLMILIWGLAYISVARKYEQVKWLVAVFAGEKLVYGIAWIMWLLNNSLNDVFAEDTMAGIFYSVYGLNDWIFFAFFSLVFVSLVKTKGSSIS